ncbi:MULTISPECIES: rhodanese-like domain-containing protein [Alteromonas]|jgi:phage shock protein E|uniref:Rhodanese-like domain-containing protein n=1 Tax=Alteromonas stellipolaris TaxID=233316 RepID=A0AAW7Z273_9ALTE|nr:MULTISPECIES: rhodanese-like domain-containing protein [Alteromonas]AMJ91788.1 sulfurtransferase [Alteromonas sp. Mac2]AMJ75499.1 sulfurtransferase [Alteromonas stellipolaris]AMJ87924.1 sulfurtransferase [Alteromonas sp. Mac1]ANB21365.1 sulfurtransferase [Alteromonas stellipolaris]MDO6578875.1 rhodanese-like domain-containing protein [Alteromonas stellipolaris]
MRIVLVTFLCVVAITLFVSLQCTAKATSQGSVAASPYLIERVKNNDWMLIDVRSPSDFADGHIPGAINMPQENINDYLTELEGHKDKPIIIYCQSGTQAKLAMKFLKDLDFSEVMHLEGDMLGWNASQMPIDRM